MKSCRADSDDQKAGVALGTPRHLLGALGIMEKKKKMETTMMGLYWGYFGIMEKKMENTIWGLGLWVRNLRLEFGVMRSL